MTHDDSDISPQVISLIDQAIRLLDQVAAIMQSLLALIANGEPPTIPPEIPPEDLSSYKPVSHHHSPSSVSKIQDATEAHLFERLRGQELFDQYATLKDRLTARQWLVVCLYYKEGKSQREIAQILNIRACAVYGVLQRAKQRKSDYERELRQEKFNLLRRHMENSE